MQIVDCTTAWNKCLRIIQKNLPEQSFKTWFQPIKPYKFENNVLTIQVPSQFFYEWLEENYVQILKEAMNSVIGPDAKLAYSVVVDQGGGNGKSPMTVNLPNSKLAKPVKSEKSSAYHSPFKLRNIDENYRTSQLNQNYTFDSYIEGDCNRLARSAGVAVAKKPGITSFNPLLLYGGVGLGKTHLVQAIGNEIEQSPQEKFILYVSSEKFTNQFIDAVKSNKTQEFQNFYLQVDVLIIDDVQFMAGKEKTQEMFFHIFNHLHQCGKQIIMTSDCPPRDLKGLEERLLSRFKWGLTADIQQPDLEMRIAIIHRKIEEDGIFISEDVVEYLAYSVDTNIRELEGVLISLIAHASLNRVDIDLELAKQTLKNIIADIDTEVGIDYIQKMAAEYYQVKVPQLKDKTRKREIVIARQVAMYFCKEYTSHSLKSIGHYFGNRDHSTVIHAIQTVNDLMKDDAFKTNIETLRKRIKIQAK